MSIQAKKVFDNPSPEELRAFTEEMPNARVTEFGNVNVQTRATSRSAGSTYIVTDDPGITSGQTITREEYERIARMQDEYIRGREMIVVDGFIGNVEDFQTPARLTIEKANANIAGMQEKLYYPRDGGEPEVQLIYTPNLPARGYPNERVIAVDLENRLTRVLNSDYFGESKKGGLRVWNTIVYDRGGLALHAGCKSVPANGDEGVFLIIGLSGTGKTTTTFTTQNNSLPVQDDFVALMPDGQVYASENGCFAKTFSLDPDFEPNIYNAVVKPTTYLENVYQDDSGQVNFLETSYTQNGRAVFGLEDLGRVKDARELSKVDYLLILNWNENIIPAIAKLTRTQAAAYFMLGETTGTSAGGAAEEGKFLRVPGTNPFFPLLHEQQGNRFLELLDAHPMDVFLMNTGRVGGTPDEDRSKKVKIPHSGAVVKAIAEGTISWTEDDDFGYQIAESVPGIDDPELIQPRRLYERQRRMDEYRKFVERFKAERQEYLEGFPGLDPEIIKAVL
ncbi:MAG TPA: phosphoenolpyruvate carboxykinase [Actinomycetota bacterium]|jgi:phosphoenolpyruvate carboxykinase (ATP)|nr:phosphoenolpyruvate carboxykinase [Actinomycetota bacterium]